MLAGMADRNKIRINSGGAKLGKARRKGMEL